MYYDSVYESPDRPPDHIIEDDDILDRWYENKLADYEKRSREAYMKSDNSSVSAYAHDEVVVFNHEYEEDIEED